jgi:hypothetical protein
MIIQQTDKKPPTVRHTPEQINDIVARYDPGQGLSIKKYCKGHRISEQSFYSARNRMQAKGSTATTKGFISLSPSLPQAPAATLFAEVGSIKIYQAVPAEYLKTLAS